MKAEIKKLYRIDKKLALDAAKVLGYRIVLSDEKFNPNTVKKGDVLAIGSLYSKRSKQYEPVKYTVEEVKDVKQWPNLVKETGLSNMYFMYTVKRKERVLEIFKNKYYRLSDAGFKILARGEVSDIKKLS